MLIRIIKLLSCIRYETASALWETECLMYKVLFIIFLVTLLREISKELLWSITMSPATSVPGGKYRRTLT